MVLRASWGSLRPLLNALGGLLGALLDLQMDPKGLTRSDLLRFGALFGLFLSLLLLLLLLVSATSLFILSWTLFWPILSSQDDPPTLKNHDSS